MANELVAVTGFVALFALMLLRVPIGIAMGAVGICGFGYLSGFGPAFALLAQSPIRTATEAGFAVIPLFILMGNYSSHSGMSRELFQAADSFFGHKRGGLGMATIVSSGGFAAISGSSVATAATFSSVAYPEMLRFGYPRSFAAGAVAAGGTLGILIPPSNILAVYGILTDQDIGRLFIAGLVPGILAMVMYLLTISVINWRRPDFLPARGASSRAERIAALKNVWAIALLFLCVIGGLYGGVFTPTEAAGVGATGALIISVARRKLDRAGFWEATIAAVRTTASIFLILIGALLFGYFLTITQTPQAITEFLAGLGIGRYGVLVLILLMYVILGCLMDTMAMVILTVPIVYPVILALGFDPIWFGIIIVMTVELGLITPPVGMNIFVIKGVVRNIELPDIFRGVLPFVVTDLIRLAILILLPAIVLWLPSQM
ncbi:TRAP transporter large permease [Amorphus coralli]|uniref:TRAP transporter large permease n=1 Tax=Amorphus coralli TaxID=340680 RepID=UPI000365BBA2|nr:TRAP transporter large permease [Amorphus coralli]